MDKSDNSTKELITAINLLLHTKRNTLPTDAEQLLRLAKAELEQQVSDPQKEERSSSAVQRIAGFLLMAFAKEEVIDRLGGMDEWLDDIVNQLSDLLQ